MTRNSFRIYGLCALVFGLMIFSADGAQGARWLILTSAGVLKEGFLLHASVDLEKDSSVYVLHSEILKIKVLFLCTAVKVIEAKFLANGFIGREEGVLSNSKGLFSGCTTDLNGSPVPECTPKDLTDGEGKIVTQTLHAQLELGIAGEDLLKVLPDNGETYAFIETGFACPIGSKVPVLGKFTFKDCENLALTHMVKHLVEPGPGTELFTISKSAEHVATFLGSAWAVLTGEHAGLQWSGEPS